jgi:hypothetical protein
MIYGRCQQEVLIIRRATLADVRRLDRRVPDAQDRAALAAGSYVIVADHGQERLYHVAFLRADGGSLEIQRAIEAADGPQKIRGKSGKL